VYSLLIITLIAVCLHEFVVLDGSGQVTTFHKTLDYFFFFPLLNHYFPMFLKFPEARDVVGGTVSTVVGWHKGWGGGHLVVCVMSSFLSFFSFYRCAV